MASVIGYQLAAESAGSSVAVGALIGRPDRQRSPRTDASLAALVESQIIPRLMRAHPVISDEARHGADRIAATDIEGFAPLAIASDANTLLASAERLLDRGVSVETVLIDLLVPAARRLGVWWEEDRCDFVEVTMGLWRLQEVARELSGRVPGRSGRPQGRRRALFVPVPGDQHSFGAVLVDEFFRREGWDSEVDCEITLPDLLARVGGAWLDIVGLTASCDCHIARLPSIILALRSVSRNPRLRIMVGGRVCLEDESLAARIGADGSAADARHAVRVAGDLVDALAAVAALCD